LSVSTSIAFGREARRAFPAVLATKTPRFGHVEFCPVDAIVQRSLLAARQHHLALILGQAQIGGDFFSRQRHARFAFGGDRKDGQHQLLIIGNSHRGSG
jgi:hypothetical protein